MPKTWRILPSELVNIQVIHSVSVSKKTNDLAPGIWFNSKDSTTLNVYRQMSRVRILTGEVSLAFEWRRVEGWVDYPSSFGGFSMIKKRNQTFMALKKKLSQTRHQLENQGKVHSNKSQINGKNSMQITVAILIYFL